MVKKNLALILILILAFVLRFYKLGLVPASLNWDENSNGYNAYSILKTGRDEYGNFLPLTNRSFDDYKPPLYMYLTVPSVALFGLTPFAVRLPSALFGFLTIPVFYLLAHTLAKNSGIKNYETLSLLATFFLATSTWHLQFSRVGFEATVGLFFATAGVTSFLYGLKKPLLLPISAILLALSLYSYHAERIFLPLMVIPAVLIYKKELFQIPKKYLAGSALIFLLLVLPLALFLPKEALFQRLQSSQTSIQQTTTDASIRLKSQDWGALSSKIKFIHPRRVLTIFSYFGNYISHFNANFLFTMGDDNFRHHVQNMGMFYLFNLPLFLFGIYFLVKKLTKSSVFILSWLILSPVPAIPVTPAPHAIRSFQMVIAFLLVCAYGFIYLQEKKNVVKKIAISIIAGWVTLSILLYLHNYYIHYKLNKASEWQYGYSQAASYTNAVKDKYKKINVSPNLEQAYIFWLFATKYDPAAYQKQGSREHFDKFYFGKDADRSDGELFVSTPQKKPDELTPSIPKDYKVEKIIYGPDGSPAIEIARP